MIQSFILYCIPHYRCSYCYSCK